MKLVRRNLEGDLERFWLFADCSKKGLAEIENLGTRVKVPANRVLVREGGRDSDLMIVVAGTATCLIRGVVVAEFSDGDFFGEIAALDGGRRTATVIATTDMEILIFNKDEFGVLLDISPQVAKRILFASARRLRMANNLVTV
jgi:CRP-like cAMP-binding protein